MSEIDLILFLEWLDYTGEVREWAPASDTHEDVARRYLAQRTAQEDAS